MAHFFINLLSSGEANEGVHPSHCTCKTPPSFVNPSLARQSRECKFSKARAQSKKNQCSKTRLRKTYQFSGAKSTTKYQFSQANLLRSQQLYICTCAVNYLARLRSNTRMCILLGSTNKFFGLISQCMISNAWRCESALQICAHSKAMAPEIYAAKNK